VIKLIIVNNLYWLPVISAKTNSAKATRPEVFYVFFLWPSHPKFWPNFLVNSAMVKTGMLKNRGTRPNTETILLYYNECSDKNVTRWRGQLKWISYRNCSRLVPIFVHRHFFKNKISTKDFGKFFKQHHSRNSHFIIIIF
jgi:hypothetical protein